PTEEPTEQPTEQPQEPSSERVFGRNRVLTALEAFKAGDYTSGKAVLANANTFADALAAGPLAAALDAPVVLTSGKTLEPAVLQALREGKITEVFVTGSEGSISAQVVSELEKAGMKVERLGGDNRFDTALVIAARTAQVKPPTTIFIVDGTNYADGLAAGSVAEYANAVMVLSNGNKLPRATELYLRQHPQAKVVAVGGNAGRAATAAGWVSGINLKIIAGENRYATNARLAREYAADVKYIVVASGENFPDALAGAALAAQKHGVLVLSPRGHLSPVIETLLESLRPHTAVLLGGPQVVSPAVEKAVGEIMNAKP
ncbi:cell wall-binding repeat-containing protein, partial [Buchananella hordeovulneris]